MHYKYCKFEGKIRRKVSKKLYFDFFQINFSKEGFFDLLKFFFDKIRTYNSFVGSQIAQVSPQMAVFPISKKPCFFGCCTYLSISAGMLTLTKLIHRLLLQAV
jgi:hypothetical protein